MLARRRRGVERRLEGSEARVECPARTSSAHSAETAANRQAGLVGRSVGTASLPGLAHSRDATAASQKLHTKVMGRVSWGGHAGRLASAAPQQVETGGTQRPHQQGHAFSGQLPLQPCLGWSSCLLGNQGSLQLQAQRLPVPSTAARGLHLEPLAGGGGVRADDDSQPHRQSAVSCPRGGSLKYYKNDRLVN